MGISNLTEKQVNNMKESAVSDHRLQRDCVISFDNFDVLASDTNNFKLLIKESLLIKRNKPILNRTLRHSRRNSLTNLISLLLNYQGSLFFYTSSN